LLEADLEVGCQGECRSHLAGAGRYYLSRSATNRRIDRGPVRRMGEAAIKELVDGLTNLVQTLVLGGSPAAAVA
jgi:hypothetical protein